MYERFTVGPTGYFDFLIKPTFADIYGEGPGSGTLGTWSLMDGVSSKRKITELKGRQNILKRRDASCNIEFTNVAKASIRSIETDEIYAGTKVCDNEFYQGCLKDFRNKDPKFRSFIMKFFLDAIQTDVRSNAYFGDITRLNDPDADWSWNVFDGIFKHYAKYINDGTIKANQTTAFDSGAITPAEAKEYLDWAHKNQDDYLDFRPDEAKLFYVSKGIFVGYEDYLIATGQAYNISLLQNGIKVLKYKNIDVLLETTWSPILKALNGGVEANACILTLKGNFTFATDTNYGEDTDEGVKPLLVWYSKDELTWKYANFLKAGTGIAYPEHSVIGMTNIAALN